MTLLNDLKRFTPMAGMVAPRRTALPMLKRISFQDGLLIASDLGHLVVAPLSAGGDYQIPVKTIADILTNKPETLTIREKKTDQGYEMLKIAFDGITATIPKSGGDFPALPSGDFDPIGEWPREFVRMLEQQLPFVSKDELKPSLTGILIEATDGIVVSVATNGHVLRQVQNWPLDGEDFVFIVSPKTIRFLVRFMGESVTVAKTADHVRFTLDNDVIFHSRLIDERYPDYQSVFPKEHKGSAYFNRDAALKVLRGLEQFCDPTTKQMAIGTTPTEAAVTAVNAGTNSSGEGSFPLDNVDGEITIRYNINCLINALKSCGTPIRWEWDTPVQAALFFEAEQEDVRVILMPIRLND